MSDLLSLAVVKLNIQSQVKAAFFFKGRDKYIPEEDVI
jgi:hypothetical protein